MLMSTARDYIRPECVEIYLPLIRALIAETRKESGCLQYDLFRDIENEGQFVLLERWENAECLEQHLSSPHFSKIVPQIQQLQCSRTRFLRISDNENENFIGKSRKEFLAPLTRTDDP